MASSSSQSSFWTSLDHPLASHQTIIDRPKGSSHPRYPEDIYPLDYGHLEGTLGNDGSGIDIWVGTAEARVISAIIVTVDLQKRDSEIKILFGCTKEETATVLARHNSGMQSAILVERN